MIFYDGRMELINIIKNTFSIFQKKADFQYAPNLQIINLNLTKYIMYASILVHFFTIFVIGPYRSHKWSNVYFFEEMKFSQIPKN